MAHFRQEKKHLLAQLAKLDWKTRIYHTMTTAEQARRWTNPLLAMLPRPEVQYQAAICFGHAISMLAEQDMEEARNIMRRLMWSLNEDSGNLGWGIPQAMGCCIAENKRLASEFARILLSYCIDTSKANNYLELPPLRYGVYWGVGYAFMQKVPLEAFGQGALRWLIKGISDEDVDCRSVAAWATVQMLTLIMTDYPAQVEAAKQSDILDEAATKLHQLSDEHATDTIMIPVPEEDQLIARPVKQIAESGLTLLSTIMT